MNFIRSTAIWSMAGYIIGLGDRHCQNILMKNNTSEVVHIDYGIILENGKNLPVPEEVQFRLTPNISHSLDIFQGKTLFFHYCHNILNAFSKEKGSIFEIIESVLKLNKEQNHNDIIILKTKLERNTFNDINMLITSCSDSEKLSKMFRGWAAYH